MSRKKTKTNDGNETPTEQKHGKANLETVIPKKTTEKDVEALNVRRGEMTTEGKTDLTGIKVGTAEAAMKKAVVKKVLETRKVVEMVVVTRNVERIEKKNQYSRKCPEQNKWISEI